MYIALSCIAKLGCRSGGEVVTYSVWLCDLTYTQQIIANDVMPASVGCLATYAGANLDPKPNFRLFKRPDKLIKALESGERPDVIGFSNYIWNVRLSHAFASVIKAELPGVITVFGGPNYPIDVASQDEFLRLHNSIDFYVQGEGERPFVELLRALHAASFDKAQITAPIDGVHYIAGDQVIRGKTGLRLKTLDDVPSPYVSGLLDEFFDGELAPIVQTSRGCPFSCSFCVEGIDYHRKIAKSASPRVRDELLYVAEHMAPLIKNRGRSDLYIADSNFGMYPEDIGTAEVLAGTQDKYGYPTYINCTTGKNQHERILRVASMVNGAIKLSGAVQSLDAEVLATIKRSNISADQIMSLGKSSTDAGADSYSQVILALPNDSVAKHFETLRIIVDAGFNKIGLNQLMMLPGSEIGLPSERAKYGMGTKWRILSRSFGYFELFGHEINVAEFEEICVSLKSLSFEDYLRCRRMHLIIFLFYNDGFFTALKSLLHALNISVWQWLLMLEETKFDGDVAAIFDSYLADTVGELWDTADDLAEFVSKKENILRCIDDEHGSNVIMKHKALAMIKGGQGLADAALATTLALLEQHGAGKQERELAIEASEYDYLRLRNVFFETDKQFEQTFRFDIPRLIKEFRTNPRLGYAMNASDFLAAAPVTLTFAHTPAQQEQIAGYRTRYGTDNLAALARVVARVYINRMLRAVQSPLADVALEGSLANTETAGYDALYLDQE